MSRVTRTKDPDVRQKILARLRSAEGHLRSVVQMVERDAYCIDVLHQTRAVQAALERASAVVLDRHLHRCVSRAIRSQDAGERERVIAELLDVVGRGAR
jgi:DNA-binding FrmR family transcriptional regulator